MQEAYASGRFDFRHANLHSASWWRRLFLVLRQLYQERLAAQLLEQRQEVLLSLVVSGDSTQRQTLAELLQRTAQQQNQLRFPWEKQDEQSRIKTVAEQAKQAWIDNWGDTSDPAVAAKIDATADAILQRAKTRKSRNA